jgi:cytochrome c
MGDSPTLDAPDLCTGEDGSHLAIDSGEAPGSGPSAGPELIEAGGGQMGGMMMGGGQVPNLKTLDPEDRVQSIDHCGDTYKVATADGKVRDFWERNLRFKTDVSGDGPQKGAPAIVGAGLMGDRADVIFSSHDEISGFISHRC